MQNKNHQNIRRMVVVGMFTAMAYVAMLFIHIKVDFLTLDVKDAVITLCGLYFGPLSALFISTLVPMLEFFTISETGVYGLIMNILGSVAFSVTASLIYKWKKTLAGAFLGLFSGAICMTAVMLLANLWITPYYMGVPVSAVREMLPTLLLPFNLLKGIVNIGLVLLLYKSVSRALHKAGFLRASEMARNTEEISQPRKRNWRTSIVITVVSIILIVLSLLLIFLVLGGKFDFI